MKTNIKVLIFSLVILVASSFVPVQPMVMAASQQLFGYAWSENTGWLQFEPVFGGVFADDTTGDLSGYAWSENLGWVSFEPSDLAGCPSAPCVANLDEVTGVASGWAKAISGTSSGWDGWISLKGASPDYGVNMNLDTGDFSGWAWGSDVVGWLSFSGVTNSGDAYKVSCPACVGLQVGPSLNVSLSANPSSGSAPLSSTLSAAVTGKATGDILYKFDCQNDGTYEYSFTSSNPTESRSCDYATNGSYTAKVYVEREGLNDSAQVPISVGNSLLNVSLSANPSSGSAPLSSTLSAAVTGKATGDILYKFDCQNDGTYEYSFTSSNPTESRSCDYATNGSYTAKVYVERGGLNDSAQVSISVKTALPYYDLSVTGALYATIVKNSGPVNSKGTASVTVDASNFSGDIKLTSNIDSIQGLVGASVVFSDNLLSPGSSGYESSGISIKNIPETVVAGLYDITIYGNDTASALGERSATLRLNIESLSPKWKEI